MIDSYRSSRRETLPTDNKLTGVHWLQGRRGWSSCEAEERVSPSSISTTESLSYTHLGRSPERQAAARTGPDHPHSLSYKLELGSDQEIPYNWYSFATVQFVVPDACASGAKVKSLGIESDVQPQKHILQKTCYNCQVEIEKKWIRLDGEDPSKAGSCQMQ
ncbi:stonin-1 isoform X2 [Hemicordylus capensis]|uniref:stonin-1 isoform X2 n=1 Tax=Hemicordylus capensis TaxID=884348 RepID=UPI00230435D1|nr:stonin-1 isoform X2 [Hemicordylus capensis]